MVLSFILLCPVHCLSKAPNDNRPNVYPVEDCEQPEQNTELRNISDHSTEKNVLLPALHGNLESDPFNTESDRSNSTSDLDKIF